MRRPPKSLDFNKWMSLRHTLIGRPVRISGIWTKISDTYFTIGHITAAERTDGFFNWNLYDEAVYLPRRKGDVVRFWK